MGYLLCISYPLKKILNLFYISIYLFVNNIAFGAGCTLNSSRTACDGSPGGIDYCINYSPEPEVNNLECFYYNNGKDKKCCEVIKCKEESEKRNSKTLECECNNDKYYYSYNNICLQCGADWTWNDEKAQDQKYKNTCTKSCSPTDIKIDKCETTNGNVIKKNNDDIDTSNCTCTQCITGYYVKTENNNTTCEPKTITFTFSNQDADDPNINKPNNITLTYRTTLTGITDFTKPIKKGHTFGGYCITENNTETCYFNGDGNFIPPPSDIWNFNSITKQIDLKAKWILKTDIACKAGFYLKQNTDECNTTCEKDNYCPGGEKYNFSTTIDQGIIHCYSGFSTDGGTGKSSPEYCKQVCDTIDNCNKISGSKYQNKDDTIGNSCKCDECNPKFKKSQNEKFCEPKICTEANKYLDDNGICQPCDKDYHSPKNNSGGIDSCKKKCNISDCSSYEESEIEQGTNKTCKCNKCKTGKIAKDGNCQNCKSPYWCPDGGKNICKSKSGEASSNIKNDNSKLEALWVDGSGCKCPVGMSSKEQATNITDCKYTLKTKFCFPTTSPVKCFTIQELGDLETKEGKFQDGWKVVY